MTGIDQLPVEQLEEAFDRLPDELRQPLYLTRAEHLSRAEVAAQLGIS
jgi:DNA-directed RNA polymerase specialized sigma24 family protein